MDRRRFSMLALASALGSAAGSSWAQERLDKNVVVTFPPPIPSRTRLLAELTARFGGNCVVEGYGSSRDYEVLQRAVMRAALGPGLDAGKSTYVLVTETHDLVYDGFPERARFTSGDFRAVYMRGLPPHVLVACAAAGITSAQELPGLARQRAAAGRPLNCDAGRGLGQFLTKRLARLLGTELSMAIHPRPPHPDSMLDSRGVDLFIAPLSPVLLGRARQSRLWPLAVLADSALPVQRTLEGLGASDYALPRLAPDGPFASLGVVPTLGAFVARSEGEDTIRRLHAAFAASAEDPADANDDNAYISDESSTPERAAAWYERERLRLDALKRGVA